MATVLGGPTTGLVEAGFLESRAGEFRLFDRSEFPSTRNPATDVRPTVWEVAQNLILAPDTGGEPKAGAVLQLGGRSGR